MHSFNIFGARTNHGQPRTHKTHHGLDFGGSNHLPPYNILCAFSWGPHPNGILFRDSQVGVPEFPQLGLSQLCGPVILRVDLWLQWGEKKSCSPSRELFNGMLHVTCTWGNVVDSWLLMASSQTTNLTPDLSFGHNLCFRCPNGPLLSLFV